MTKRAPSKAFPGSVLLIPLRTGVGLAQYVGEHHELGACLWVVPQPFASVPDDLPGALAHGYYTFFPLRAALRAGFVSVIGTVELEERQVPHTTRRAGARASSGEVLTWVIEGPGGTRVVPALTASERMLPIASIWNLEYLTDRISERWRPQDS